MTDSPLGLAERFVDELVNSDDEERNRHACEDYCARLETTHKSLRQNLKIKNKEKNERQNVEISTRT